jgi:hypothetical protein
MFKGEIQLRWFITPGLIAEPGEEFRRTKIEFEGRDIIWKAKVSCGVFLKRGCLETEDEAFGGWFISPLVVRKAVGRTTDGAEVARAQ